MLINMLILIGLLMSPSKPSLTVLLLLYSSLAVINQTGIFLLIFLISLRISVPLISTKCISVNTISKSETKRINPFISRELLHSFTLNPFCIRNSFIRFPSEISSSKISILSYFRTLPEISFLNKDSSGIKSLI